MKKTNLFTLFLPIGLILTGCGLISQTAPTPTIALPTFTPIVLPTEIPLPTAAPTIALPTLTPAPTSTQAPVTMLNAEVNMDNFTLRAGPGRLFERLELYDTGATVNLIGRENSNNWVLVQTSDHRSGWMNLVGLNVYGAVTSLPIYAVNDAIILHGHVYLPGKLPIKGVGVSITPADVDDPSQNDVCATNDAGEWSIYLPLNTKGSWAVAPNSFFCDEPNAMEAPYDCNTNFTIPDAQIFTLPLDLNVEIEFEIVPLGN